MLDFIPRFCYHIEIRSDKFFLVSLPICKSLQIGKDWKFCPRIFCHSWILLTLYSVLVISYYFRILRIECVYANLVPNASLSLCKNVDFARIFVNVAEIKTFQQLRFHALSEGRDSVKISSTQRVIFFVKTVINAYAVLGVDASPSAHQSEHTFPHRIFLQSCAIIKPLSLTATRSPFLKSEFKTVLTVLEVRLSKFFIIFNFIINVRLMMIYTWSVTPQPCWFQLKKMVLVQKLKSLTVLKNIPI